MSGKKVVFNYRVTIDDVEAGICFDFDEKGTACIADGKTPPAVFDREFMAHRLINRTLEARENVKRSLFPDFKAFRPLFYKGSLGVMPFDAAKEKEAKKAV